jgi:hypothetical protein
MTQALAIINATRESARQSLKQAAIEMARQTAAQLARIVVTSEPEAGHVTDLLREVKQGQKAAKAALDGVCYVHQQAIDAARGEFEEIVKALADAEKGAKDALAAYIDAKDRAARDAQRKAQAEAAERLERHRREALEEIERLEEERSASLAEGQLSEIAGYDAAIGPADGDLRRAGRDADARPEGIHAPPPDATGRDGGRGRGRSIRRDAARAP